MQIRHLGQDVLLAGGGAFGVTPLWHFIYRSPGRRQLTMSGFCGPLTRPAAYKSVLRDYTALAAQMHDTKGHIIQRC